MQDKRRLIRGVESVVLGEMTFGEVAEIMRRICPTGNFFEHEQDRLSFEMISEPTTEEDGTVMAPGLYIAFIPEGEDPNMSIYYGPLDVDMNLAPVTLN